MTKTTAKEIGISAIEKGTVIDHIKSENTLKVVKILKLSDEEIMVGINFKSKKLGKKGMIKISNKILDLDEINKISFVAPNATVAIIEDYKITKKSSLEFPKEFIGVLKCQNQNCITNNERMKTHFVTIKKEPIMVKCVYCEKIFGNTLELSN